MSAARPLSLRSQACNRCLLSGLSSGGEPGPTAAALSAQNLELGQPWVG